MIKFLGITFYNPFKWRIVQDGTGVYYVRKGNLFMGNIKYKDIAFKKDAADIFCDHDTLEEARETLQRVKDLEIQAKQKKPHKTIEQ